MNRSDQHLSEQVKVAVREIGSTSPISFITTNTRAATIDSSEPEKGLISPSYVEKHNQTVRQSMARLARPTAGHSRKIDSHVAMFALYACINSAVRMSPAMACGPEQRLWDIGNIVQLTDTHEDQAKAA